MFVYLLVIKLSSSEMNVLYTLDDHVEISTMCVCVCVVLLLVVLFMPLMAAQF